jgi:hypothetical protein
VSLAKQRGSYQAIPVPFPIHKAGHFPSCFNSTTYRKWQPMDKVNLGPQKAGNVSKADKKYLRFIRKPLRLNRLSESRKCVINSDAFGQNATA